jgi:HlyD family secretion protein
MNRNRRVRGVVAAAAALGLALAAAGCGRKATGEGGLPVEAVARRDIRVTVEASGTIEPVDLVEVKSKASGQIVRMPVEIGSVVRKSDLLVQVDPRDVQNSYDQAEASLQAAEARAEIAKRQRQRSDELLAEQVITAAEHETAVLDDANARSALVAARTNLDLAKQRLEDATIRAPLAGTVLEKPVAVGQVISSATSSVGGGTTLLKMADLSRIRMRALVAEADIGRVRAGQSVRVEVDAFAGRAFPGTVEKIEPQAVVQQSVTMFPVLVSISNEQGLLLPGMNGEVTMLVDERENVVAVPIDGLRSAREISAVAETFGLDPDTVQALASRRGGAGAGAALAAAAGADSAGASRGAGAEGGAPGVAGASRGGAQGLDPRMLARMRERMGGGEITPEMIARMRARMAAGGGGGAGAGAGRGGGFGAAATRTQVAIVRTGKGFEPRLVRVGISDFDYAEVLGGLEEGDQVAMLSYAEMKAQRERITSFARSRMSGGLTTQSGTGRTTGAGAGGVPGGGPGGGPPAGGP